MSIKRVALDTGLDSEMIKKIFMRFQDDEKIFYDNGWMVVRNFVKHQNTKSDLVKKGIENELKNAPRILLQYVYNLESAMKYEKI